MGQVVKQNPSYDWEFLLVNDGSMDNTLQQMMRLHDEDPHYSYLDLSRNYGKEIAMMAGFDYATGDAVIVMDADMQHPIEVIPEMLKYWEEGYDDVYAQRQGSKESWLKRKTSHWYYKLLQSVTKVPIQKDTGDFRLLDRSCVEALKQMRETERNTKGMYSWIGFHKKGITYQQLEGRCQQMEHEVVGEPCPERYHVVHHSALATGVCTGIAGVVYRFPVSYLYHYRHQSVWRTRSGLSNYHGDCTVSGWCATAQSGYSGRIPWKGVQRGERSPGVFPEFV